MAARLRIHTTGAPDQEAPLRHELTTLGRDGACQIRIDHPEVADQVATIAARGGSYLVQNLCRYDVFLGQQSIRPGAWSEWRFDQRLLLSRNVSATLVAETGPNGAPSAAAPQDVTGSSAAAIESRRKMIQMGVTVGCLGLGGLLLFAGQEDHRAPESEDSFEQLLSDLNQSNPFRHDDAIIRDRLQAAWLAEQRERASDSHDGSLAKYRLLMNEPAIRSAAIARDTIYGRIKIFAAHRIDRLTH